VFFSAWEVQKHGDVDQAAIVADNPASVAF
jgi:hypothetical protein